MCQRKPAASFFGTFCSEHKPLHSHFQFAVPSSTLEVSQGLGRADATAFPAFQLPIYASAQHASARTFLRE